MCLLLLQSEAEQECSSLTSFRNTGNLDLEVSNGRKTGGFVTSRSSSSDMEDQLKGLRTWSSQHSTLEPSHDSGSLLVQTGPTYFLYLRIMIVIVLLMT